MNPGQWIRIEFVAYPGYENHCYPPLVGELISETPNELVIRNVLDIGSGVYEQATKNIVVLNKRHILYTELLPYVPFVGEEVTEE